MSQAEGENTGYSVEGAENRVSSQKQLSLQVLGLEISQRRSWSCRKGMDVTIRYRYFFFSFLFKKNYLFFN